MSSATETKAVLIKLPPDLLARVDRLAIAQERPRAFITRKALAAYCDAHEASSSSAAPASAAGAGVSAPAHDAAVILNAAARGRDGALSDSTIEGEGSRI